MKRLPSAQGFLLGRWDTDITCGGDNSKHSSALSNGRHVNFYRHGLCYTKLKFTYRKGIPVLFTLSHKCLLFTQYL